MTLRRRRLVILASTMLAVLVLVVVWFWGVRPANGLEQEEVVQVLLATNRSDQSLWDTGYHPEDCTQLEQMDQAYTCQLIGSSLEEVTSAVGQHALSYYVPGRDPVPNPVHTISFKTADGTYYLLAVKSLAEAYRGVFYGFRSAGQSISSGEIHWFRYANPALGQVLTKMREAPVWSHKAPTPPDPTGFDRGDAEKRPVIHTVGISAYEQKNGWWIAPMSLYRVVASVENADKVTFYGLVADEPINPDKNGFVNLPVVQETNGAVQRWVAVVHNCCGGPSMGFYAVAENQFGRTVSPAFYVAWVPESDYPDKELVEP